MPPDIFATDFARNPGVSGELPVEEMFHFPVIQHLGLDRVGKLSPGFQGSKSKRVERRDTHLIETGLTSVRTVLGDPKPKIERGGASEGND
jgi:hypothetical protein